VCIPRPVKRQERVNKRRGRGERERTDESSSHLRASQLLVKSKCRSMSLAPAVKGMGGLVGVDGGLLNGRLSDQAKLWPGLARA